MVKRLRWHSLFGDIEVEEPEETDPQQRDRRQGKRLLWKEVKLCLAHAHGGATPVYGGTLFGGVDAAGR